MEEHLFKRFFWKAVGIVFKQILKFSAPNQFSASFLKYMFCSRTVCSQIWGCLLCVRHPHHPPRSEQAMRNSASIGTSESVTESSPHAVACSWAHQSRPPTVTSRDSQTLSCKAFGVGSGLVPSPSLWCPAPLAMGLLLNNFVISKWRGKAQSGSF